MRKGVLMFNYIVMIYITIEVFDPFSYLGRLNWISNISSATGIFSNNMKTGKSNPDILYQVYMARVAYGPGCYRCVALTYPYHVDGSLTPSEPS